MLPSSSLAAAMHEAWIGIQPLFFGFPAPLMRRCVAFGVVTAQLNFKSAPCGVSAPWPTVTMPRAVTFVAGSVKIVMPRCGNATAAQLWGVVFSNVQHSALAEPAPSKSWGVWDLLRHAVQKREADSCRSADIRCIRRPIDALTAGSLSLVTWHLGRHDMWR